MSTARRSRSAGPESGPRHLDDSGETAASARHSAEAAEAAEPSSCVAALLVEELSRGLQSDWSAAEVVQAMKAFALRKERELGLAAAQSSRRTERYTHNAYATAPAPPQPAGGGALCCYPTPYATDPYYSGGAALAPPGAAFDPAAAGCRAVAAAASLHRSQMQQQQQQQQQQVPMQYALAHPSQSLAYPLSNGFSASGTMSPLIFMTLTHDAIRGAMGKSVELLSGGSPSSILDGCRLLEQTSRLIDLHTRQEDEVFFPYLRKMFEASSARGGQPATLHMKVHDEHDEVASKRKTLVAKVAKQGLSLDRNIVDQVRALVRDYELHMQEEEMEIAPMIQNTNAKALEEAVQLLIRHDLHELATHAIPFTTFQLCKSAPYESVSKYATALKTYLKPEAYRNISKVMLLSAFQARPKYAAKLVEDNILEGDESNASLHSEEVPRTRTDVATWLEKESSDGWDWKNVSVERTPLETDSLLRAEKLHLKLAERFAEPLQLRHVMIERDAEKQEQTIYFFIENTWEMARRALFAKLYTRMYKERGWKLHVVIIDSKERRMLAGGKKGAGDLSQLPDTVVLASRQRRTAKASGKGGSEEEDGAAAAAAAATAVDALLLDGEGGGAADTADVAAAAAEGDEDGGPDWAEE